LGAATAAASFVSAARAESGAAATNPLKATASIKVRESMTFSPVYFAQFIVSEPVWRLRRIYVFCVSSPA
jgi:hypothetical protein